MTEQTHEAVLWEPAAGGAVQCKLCAFGCRIADGQLGRCQVRRNTDGKLYSLNYHSLCAVHVDPIEKKPLFHFQPGRASFSIAAPGCNFQCDFCQNWQISQSPRQGSNIAGQSYQPTQLVDTAVARRCSSIAYTYTEPTIFMELCAECGRLAHDADLANVFVSNGYMSLDALHYVTEFLDAINVDLKSLRDDFYRRLCKASLDPVLQSLRYLTHETDIWVEVTTLIVPGLNDSDAELQQIAAFIAEELAPYVPWHISRFHPQYNRSDAYATPPETLARAYEFGKQAGLHYVYVGNLPGSDRENTYCHQCGQLLIERTGYHLSQFNLLNGCCTGCGARMAGADLDPVQT